MDAVLRARMRGVAHRLRRFVLIEGLAWIVGFLLCGAVTQFLLDYWSRGMRRSMRAALLVAIIAYALWLLRKRLVLPLSRRIEDADVANLVERRYPGLASSLISAVRFARGEVGRSETNSPKLVESVVSEAATRVGAVDFGAVLNPSRAKRSVGVIALVLAAGTAATLAAPDLTGLWFARNVLLKNVDWPRRTHLVVDVDGDELVGALGDDILIEATAQGVQPRVVEFNYKAASGKRGRETMVTIGSAGAYRYRYTMPAAQEDFEFYLVGGDDETEPIQVRLMERPHIQSTSMHIEPPAYARLEPIELGDGQRAAQVLPGSTVVLKATTNKPVVRASLVGGGTTLAQAFGSEEPAANPVEAVPTTTSLEVTVHPTETNTYEFALVGEHGLENRKPVRFSIRVINDEPPRARVRLEGAGEMITADAVLPMAVEASDAYGLAELTLVYRVSGETPKGATIPLPTFQPGSKTFSHEFGWPASTAAAVPGEQLNLTLRARDYDDVNGPNVTETPEVSLRIVTRDELLAELARREQEYRLDFERLLKSQEKLRGDLLTALSRSPKLDAAGLASLLSPLERQQRTIAGSVNVLRQEFEQILTELRINQLVTAAAEMRLGGQIAEPLTKLARRDLVIAADTIRRWSRDAAAETASNVDPQQVAILQQMREILSNMIQWEGYQEAVNMLRDILRMQTDLESETQRTIENQAGDIFNDKKKP